MKKLLALGVLAFPAGLGIAAPTPALAAAGSSVVCDRYADSGSGTDREGGLHGSELVPYRSGQFLVDHLRRGEVGCLRGSPAAGKGLYKERLRVRGRLVRRGSPVRSLVEGPRATLAPAPASSPTTLRSEPGQVATIDGLSVPAQASELTVSHLVIDGTTETPSSTPVVDIAASNTVFADNNVTSGASRPCVRVGTPTARPSQVRVTRNRIHNCTTGVHLAAADLTTLEYNLIYDNIDRGLRIGTDGDLSFVWRNILDRNGEGVSFQNEPSLAPSSNMVRDNVITNSTTRWNAASEWTGSQRGYANYFWRNCVHAASVDTRFQTNAGVQFPTNGYGVYNPIAVGDPGYSDPDQKEFHLDPGSECRRLIETDPYTVAISGGVPGDSAITQPRPNILFIITDDQRTDTVGDLDPATDENGDGDPANDYWMPDTLKWFRDGNLDGSLVAGGSQFEQGFATTPLCCPSRASIFSGRYAHNTGVRTNSLSERLDQDLTLQRYLSDPAQGGTTYRTGMFGKFLNDWNLRLDPPHWDDWAAFVGYSDFTVNERGTLKVIGQYSTDYLGDRAKQFIDESESEEDRPWFLYLAPYAPHIEGLYPWPDMPESPPAGNNDYRQDCAVPPCLAVPPAGDSDPARKEGRVGENPLTDKPPWVRNWRDTHRIFPKDGNPGLREQSLRTLKSVDDMVDDLFTKLEERGEERNTLAFFISDNGLHWREHGDWQKERQLVAGQGCPDLNPDPFPNAQCPGTGLVSKGKPHTDSISVPYYVRWRGNPAIRRGFVDTERVVANIDLAPTAIDAAGLEPDSAVPMDGGSLLNPGQARSEILTEDFGGDPCARAAPHAFPTWAALRTKTFHYIEYYEQPLSVDPCSISGEPNREYYDLTSDPDELNNLLGDGDPGNDPPDLAGLSQRLHQTRLCAGATCPPGTNPLPNDPQPEVRVVSPPNNARVGRTVTLEAEAFDNFGVYSVEFLVDGQPLGAPITSPQWLATWDTTGLSGSHTVTAVARDDPQDTGTAASSVVQVDNSSPIGLDIEITDPQGTGPSAGRGKAETGDKIAYPFSVPMDPQSFIAGWDGSGSRPVTVNLNNDSPAHHYHDTVTVTGVDNNALGVIDLGSNDYVRGYFATVSSFTGSLTMTPDGKKIEIVLGTPVPGTSPAGTAPAGMGMTWLAPPGTARATSGAFLCGCHVRELPTVHTTGKLYDDWDF